MPLASSLFSRVITRDPPYREFHELGRWSFGSGAAVRARKFSFRVDSKVRYSPRRAGRSHGKLTSCQRIRGVARSFGAGASDGVSREGAQVL